VAARRIKAAPGAERARSVVKDLARALVTRRQPLALLRAAGQHRWAARARTGPRKVALCGANIEARRTWPAADRGIENTQT